MHYNLAALRGYPRTDQEERLDLLEAKPELNIPEELCETKRFVPHIIEEFHRLNLQELPGIRNPITNMNYTEKEAKIEADETARSAYKRYKELLGDRG